MLRSAALASLVLLGPPVASAQGIEEIQIEGSPAVRSVPADAIPTLDDPVFDRVLEAIFMRDDEIVIGVTGGGEARAYSTWFMNRYEIVNDTIGGVPIAVTWCPLCYTGIVYVRRVGGREVTFANTGMVWRDNLVMYDRQTGSWWSQAGGRAIRGEMAGARLEMYPASMMSWGEWRKLHPDTLALSKRTGEGVVGESNAAEAYQRDPALVGLAGRARFAPDGMEPKALVAGFRIEGRPYAIVLDELRDTILIAADPYPLVAAATADGSGARVFLTGDHVFEKAAAADGPVGLADRATGSGWDAVRGLAVRGPLAGRRLEEVPSFLSYWFAWKAFFPDTRVLEP